MYQIPARDLSSQGCIVNKTNDCLCYVSVADPDPDCVNSRYFSFLLIALPLFVWVISDFALSHFHFGRSFFPSAKAQQCECPAPAHLCRKGSNPQNRVRLTWINCTPILSCYFLNSYLYCTYFIYPLQC